MHVLPPKACPAALHVFVLYITRFLVHTNWLGVHDNRVLAGMKGGSATKIMLETAFMVACCRALRIPATCFPAECSVTEQLTAMYLSYEATVQRTYLEVRLSMYHAAPSWRPCSLTLPVRHRACVLLSSLLVDALGLRAHRLQRWYASLALH